MLIFESYRIMALFNPKLSSDLESFYKSRRFKKNLIDWKILSADKIPITRQRNFNFEGIIFIRPKNVF
ncbi:hypothetical protein Fluta_0964 [Fluviicola taffensis DSM 16823]|uniref:Uncharacterized protein n=1 Tax=Fluviicola taffensis (strain DSM 16823 / NCIMB 13979 / RW262) TaxID=755732 RepID=F2IK66_FLUTR|nr:hypothetical protein Fluta_0964 [Fluviicola taffensis DSM 16823]